MVSELDYLLLEHVVFLDDLDFYLWEILQCRGVTGFWLFLILVGTRAVLITKVSSGVNIFMRWVSNFCLFFLFFRTVLAC